jgi:4-aminobutyrate aminotransferase-like enzyme
VNPTPSLSSDSKTAPHGKAPASSGSFGEALRSDPRVAEAKRLLREAVADHSASINDVQPPNAALVGDFEALLADYAKLRGGPPIWPYLSAGLGNGPYIQLADGSIKLDFIGGIGVYGCGHSHPGMLDASIDAAIEDVAMQGNLQQHPPSIRISQELTKLASAGGAPLTHCMLTTSGAMANENALKLALHKATPAARILAFDNAFAGRSLALAAITDRPKYRQGLPLALEVDYLPALQNDQPERSQRWAVNELHRLLARHPGRYAAFWAEPIAGEGGYYPGSHEFYASLCKPIREAGIPIIFDEVQSFSRTSRPFAFQHYRLDEYADIVTVGKITQVCATLYRESFKPTGPILSQTFTGASSSIAVGLATLAAMKEAECFGDHGWNVRRHDYFVKGLTRLTQEFPKHIRGPFGEGLMIAFTPGDGSFDQAKALMDIMFQEGLLGFLCGSNPTRLRFLPPPVITTFEHIDAAIELLGRALKRFAAA